MKDELRANGEETNDGNIDNDVFDEEDHVFYNSLEKSDLDIHVFIIV